MEFPLSKYRFIVHDNDVIAISSYAGKIVKGVAKTNPKDKFDEVFGKKLAAARCNQKIANKRVKRAMKKKLEAQKILDEAIAYYNRMDAYYKDSKESLSKACDKTASLLENQ